jgi:O-antigen/teichoic acid export membrane protein
MSKEIKPSNHVEDNYKHPSSATTQSADKFVSPGILLFIDQLLTAVGGWVYWLVVSKFVLTSDIGHATTVYSLVIVVNTVAQLGLEYPLLKKSIAHRQQVFGTVALIELAITAASIPVILYATGSLYQESSEFTWLAIGILVFSALGFVSRFALLGLSKSKAILLLDLAGTVLKFTSAFVLVSAGYGALGILVSFMIQAVVITSGTMIVAGRSFGLGIGNLSFMKEILKDGLVNLPSKLSGILIISLSVVLLSSFGVPSSEVGIYYIAMMVSIVVGSFGSSLAFMSIPASSALNKDLSAGSLRIGLAFTAPIISGLIAAPAFVLSIVGAEYTQASQILVILAAGVLPSVLLANAMSKFNIQNKPKHLLAIGSLRVGAFIAAFFVLVPQFGTLGAAYAILISFSTASILTIIWSEKTSLRFIGISMLSVILGVLAGRSLMFMLQEPHPVLVIGVSLVVSVLIIFGLRGTSAREIVIMIASIRKG